MNPSRTPFQQFRQRWQVSRLWSFLQGKKTAKVGPEVPKSRYARDWDTYSQRWEAQYAEQYQHLGDEWNDDHTTDRQRDTFYFTAYAERWINADMTVLEVGPGGGKWTVRIAPRVKRLVVLDVAEEMLKRTKSRCESLGFTNVEYLQANGKDFQPLADKSIDFFFSYDVFVHLALEDTWPYTQEIMRVLKPGGQGACHYASNALPEAWDRIEQNNDWYRGGQHTLGQYYYLSPEALRRMYERCGLRILEQHQEGWHCTCIFEKPSESMVPQLEGLLRQLTSQEAESDQVRAAIVAALRSLPSELAHGLEPLLAQIQGEASAAQRHHYVAAIRRLWRGI